MYRKLLTKIYFMRYECLQHLREIKKNYELKYFYLPLTCKHHLLKPFIKIKNKSIKLLTCNIGSCPVKL